MPKGFGVSNSGSQKKKSKSGKFFSELPATKEEFLVISLPKDLEIIPLQIKPSFDEMGLYISLQIKPSFIDVKPFYQHIKFLSRFVESNSISWSDFIYNAGKFEHHKALDLAEYLTLNTKECHAVIKIDDINRMDRAKNLPAISFNYDENCQKLEDKIFDKLGKIPTFDEYCKSNNEDFLKKLEEISQDSQDSEFEPFYFILKVGNLESFDMNNIWNDDITYFLKGIEGFDGFSENGLRYSKADTYHIDEEIDAIIMAKYLTMRTKKNHVVIGILENEEVCIGKYEYDEQLKKQHQVLLKKFTKMPEYDEYVNYINELLENEIKKS